MAPVPPFLGPGFRLGARWNRLGEAVKTRKRRGKTGEKWARYGLKRVNKERKGGITREGDVFHVQFAVDLIRGSFSIMKSGT